MRNTDSMSFAMKHSPVVLAVSSGAISALSIIFPTLFFLIWASFIPLFISLKTQPVSKRLLLGFAAGLTYFAGAFHWLWWSIAWFFAFSALGASLLFLGFLVWHGFFFALFAAAPQRQSSASSQILFPALLWVVLEYWYPMLFPWQFGNMLQPHLAVIQLAEITGVAGLSFLILLINNLLFRAYERWRGGAGWVSPIVAAVGVVIALDVYGRWRLAQMEAEPPAHTLLVTIVQGNIPAAREASEEVFQQSLQAYVQLSLTTMPRQPALLVWPEVAVRATLRADDDARDALFTLAEQVGAPMLVGALDRTPQGEKLNSAFLVSPAGEIFGAYHKMRLLPFAESLPPPLHVFTPWWPSAGFAAGRNTSVLLLPGARLAASICYEALFPGFFRQALIDEADFLVNLTNDIWLGSTSGPWSHLQAAAMRAVESRRWLVRAANSGASAIIAPSGRIVARTELFTEAVLQERIALRRDNTFYTRWGDWFVFVCLGNICLLGGYHVWLRTRFKTPE